MLSETAFIGSRLAIWRLATGQFGPMNAHRRLLFGHDGGLTAQQGFIRSIEVITSDDGSPRDGFPWKLPAVAALADGLSLDPKVTYLAGENGSGESTLIEAFAVAAGLNPEGGSRNFSYSTRDSHSGLPAALRLTRSFLESRERFLDRLLAE